MYHLNSLFRYFISCTYKFCVSFPALVLKVVFTSMTRPHLLLCMGMTLNWAVVDTEMMTTSGRSTKMENMVGKLAFFSRFMFLQRSTVYSMYSELQVVVQLRYAKSKRAV